MTSMKINDLYEAGTLARTVSKSFEIGVAMAEAGHEADAQYRVQIAHAALHSLADHLGYRIDRFPAPLEEHSTLSHRIQGIA